MRKGTRKSDSAL
uniref:Uncharacterized protein n=1 Tax=Anguilla anguilla TaxID=7936 RepID=A0A0E9S9L9_ANGAN